jgi:hypothetical protein
MLVGCTQEEPVSKLSGLEVDNDYVSVAADEGSAVTIKVKGDDSWTAAIPDTKVDWLTVNPTSGAAGQEVTVTFTAKATAAARGTEVHFTMGSKVKIVKVNQQAPAGVEVKPSTVAEVLAGDEGKTYRVTGTVVSIANTSYGNWYMNDGTSDTNLYIYGTFNSKSQYPKDADGGWAGFGIEVGDKVTVEGPKTVYSGTVELVDVSIIKIEKSLIDASLTTPTVGPAAGSDTLNVASKVQPVLVDIAADWVKITDFTEDGNYILAYEENLFTAPRTAVINIKAPGAMKSVTLTQEGVPATGASVTDIIAQADGSVVQTLPSTVVVALTTKGAVLSDGTKAIYAYGESAAALEIGDGVRMSATKKTYNGVPELDTITDVFVDSKNNTVSHPTSTDITSQVSTYTASVAEYIKLSGTLTVSGTYYNIAFDGIETTVLQGSIVAPIDAVKAASFDGKKITVTGYFNGTNTSKAGVKYVNVIATKIEEFVDNPKGTATNPYLASELAVLLTGGKTFDEDVYVKGKVSAILYTFSASYGTGTFWISDDGTAYGVAADKKSTTEPTKDFECYSVYWFGNEKKWAEGDGQLEIGDEVIVCGKVTVYNGIAETSSKKAWVYNVNGAASSANGLGNVNAPFNVAGAEACIDYQQAAIAAAKAADQPTPTFPDVCVKGKVSAILYTFSASYGTGTFWISDDGTAYGIAADKKSTTQPAKDFECYSVYMFGLEKPWVDGTSPQPAVGDDVIVKGQLTLYKGTYETSSKKAWIYSINGKTE